MRNERDFLKDVLERLNKSEIQYMLTGSMASNYWGIPRTTHDLDFVICLAPSEVDSFVDHFQGNFFIQQESVLAVFQPPFQFNLLDELSALKADFWQLREDEFELNMFQRKVLARLFGTDAWIATAEDILLHKLIWNRITPSERQLYDAAGIYAVQGTALDLPYLDRWAEKLEVQTVLNQLYSGEIVPKST